MGEYGVAHVYDNDSNEKYLLYIYDNLYFTINMVAQQNTVIVHLLSFSLINCICDSCNCTFISACVHSYGRPQRRDKDGVSSDPRSTGWLLIAVSKWPSA